MSYFDPIFDHFFNMPGDIGDRLDKQISILAKWTPPVLAVFTYIIFKTFDISQICVGAASIVLVGVVWSFLAASEAHAGSAMLRDWFWGNTINNSLRNPQHGD